MSKKDLSSSGLLPVNAEWFRRTFGFEESSDYETTQRMLMSMRVDQTTLLRTSDGTVLDCGSFELISLKEMRSSCKELLKQHQESHMDPNPDIFGPIKCGNITYNAYALHADPIAKGCIIQAASQFNCLEFPSSIQTPEDGITNYCHDRTQGPACAIACGAGTAFRNYLVQPDTSQTTIGQRKHSQLNTLDDILQKLASYRPDTPQPITVKNGYANAKSAALKDWRETIHENADELRGLLRIGIQRDTQVTALQEENITVTQVYASAIPVAYSQASSTAWEPFARIVLEGCYELTLLAAVRMALEKSLKRDSSPTRVFLTLVGGGVFGNELAWIWDAIDRAHRIVADQYGLALETYFVHYQEVPPEAESFVHHWNGRNNAPSS